jgi:prepilin-type N-terminal cleavage/methylation domain-containing protein
MKEGKYQVEQGGIWRRPQHGFTLVEMAVAMAISSVLFAAIANMLAGSQRDWNRTYQRVHGDVVRDAYTARSVFDKAVRKASVKKCVLGTGGGAVEVYYYSSPIGLTSPDRYANFYRSGNRLLVERGQLAPGTFNHASNNNPATQVVARNVSSCVFTQVGACVHMHMAMNDGKVDLPVTSTATRHNE